MGDQIVSPEMHNARGGDAFKRGRSRDSHGMNPQAPALHDWLAGWDHAATLRSMDQSTGATSAQLDSRQASSP